MEHTWGRRLMAQGWRPRSEHFAGSCVKLSVNWQFGHYTLDFAPKALAQKSSVMFIISLLEQLSGLFFDSPYAKLYFPLQGSYKNSSSGVFIYFYDIDNHILRICHSVHVEKRRNDIDRYTTLIQFLQKCRWAYNNLLNFWFELV